VTVILRSPRPNSYLDQFYRPNMHYPERSSPSRGITTVSPMSRSKISRATSVRSPPVVPPIRGEAYIRQTMTQPGVYWCLDARSFRSSDFYSNSAENPGFISGPGDRTGAEAVAHQYAQALGAVRAKGPRKALVIITHHPPYSSGDTRGARQMLADIDDACTKAGIMPDAFFSGHAHSIQAVIRPDCPVRRQISPDSIRRFRGAAAMAGRRLPRLPAQGGKPRVRNSPTRDGAISTLTVTRRRRWTITSHGVDAGTKQGHRHCPRLDCGS